MPLKPGDKAPIFSLISSDKKETSLNDYRGKNVVLLFFPMAFTSTCTVELCTMRDNIVTYEGLDAQILAISVDSPFSLDKFRTEQQLNFPLLSDFNKEVSRAYDVLYEEYSLGMKGVAKRSAFVIDKQGVVRYAEVLESPGDLPDFAQVQETLNALDK